MAGAQLGKRAKPPGGVYSKSFSRIIFSRSLEVAVYHIHSARAARDALSHEELNYVIYLALVKQVSSTYHRSSTSLGFTQIRIGI